MHFDPLPEGPPRILLTLVDLQVLDEGLDVAVHLAVLHGDFGVDREQALRHVDPRMGFQQTVQVRQFGLLHFEVYVEIRGPGGRAEPALEHRGATAHEGPFGVELGPLKVGMVAQVGQIQAQV